MPSDPIRRCAVAFVLAILATALPNDCFAQENAEEQALVVARRAAQRFRVGEYESAAVLLREAIDLHETAALRFNLARSLQHLERWDEARVEYRRSLVLEPEGANRRRVEDAIQGLDEAQAQHQAQLEQQAQLAEQAQLERQAQQALERERAAEQNEQTRAALGSSVAPWVLFGVGAAVAVGGIPFGALSASAEDDARNAIDQRAAEGPAANARTFAITADLLFALGGAMALGGLTWALVARRKNTESAALRVGPGGISLTGNF